MPVSRLQVKDLSVLNRDLSKVIVVDDDGISIQMCKDNAVRITPWYVVLFLFWFSLLVLGCPLPSGTTVLPQCSVREGVRVCVDVYLSVCVSKCVRVRGGAFRTSVRGASVR